MHYLNNPLLMFLCLSLVGILYFSFLVDDIFAQLSNQKPVSPRSKPIIVVGSFPVGIDINPITDKVYVANQFSDSISVIDTDKAEVETNIEVGHSPYDVEVNPFSNIVYTSNRLSDTISIIDGFAQKELGDIAVGDSPLGIGINLATNWLYVANLNSGTITVIDAIENKVMQTLDYTSLPYDIVVNPHTNRVYISDLESSRIIVLEGNSNTLISSIPVGLKPSVLAINILTNTIYVSNFLSDSISVINGTTNTVEAEIKVEENPVGITVNPNTNKIYVNNLESNSISVINGTTNKLIRNISLEPIITASGINEPFINIRTVTFPFVASKITVDPATNFVYFTNAKSNGIITIDGNTDKIIAKIFVKINPDDSGGIQCNDIRLIDGDSITLPVASEVKCEAMADRGKDFSFWSIKNNTDQNPLITNVTGYGILTANFKGAIFTEMFIILTSISIGLASTFWGLLSRQRSKRSFKKHLTNIHYTYEILSKNNKEECIKQLEKIYTNLNFLHRKGKISESQLDFLEKKIDWYISRVSVPGN